MSVDYSSLLEGGSKKSRKPVNKEVSEMRLNALAKGRETAKKNREMKGAGLLGNAAYQDIVDTDQVMYAGNPLDVLGDTRPVDIKGNGKLSKADKKCIEMAEQHMEGKGKGKMKLKIKKEHLQNEAIKRLGDIAANFTITFD